MGGYDKMAREQLKTLTEPMYYILLALNEKRYGYQIMQFIKDITDDRVIVGPGTLYALLGRFEEEDIINLVSNEERRKIYIITPRGKQILEEERDRLISLIEDGDRILNTKKDLIENKDDTDREDKNQENKDEELKPNNKSIFKRDKDILF